MKQEPVQVFIIVFSPCGGPFIIQVTCCLLGTGTSTLETKISIQIYYYSKWNFNDLCGKHFRYHHNEIIYSLNCTDYVKVGHLTVNAAVLNH